MSSSQEDALSPKHELFGPDEAPVYQTAAFGYATAEDMADVFAGRAAGSLYTRLNNPTTFALERRLAKLEGALGCIATSSGMAAINAVMTALLRPGDEILAASGIFGGTVSLFRNVLGRFGIRATHLPVEDSGAFAKAITPSTRAIFVETIGNPGMEVPDLPALGAVAHDHGIPLVVDDTVTTPALGRPGDFNADIVVCSTSKFINGHGTAIGGAILDTGRFDWARGPFSDIAQLAHKAGRLAFLAHLRTTIARDLGACPAPWTSFLMLQGLDTLAPRMHLHCANALRVAEALSSHPAIRRLRYPGLPSSPFHTLARRLFGGMGGAILTFELADQASVFRFINGLRTARLVANLGEPRTLVLHPASTIFREYEPDERLRLGVSDQLVRVSVGIEDPAQILEDFRQALDGSDAKLPQEKA